MPHPPAILPQVGNGLERGATHTLAGSKTLLTRLAARAAGGLTDFILVLSPHQPYEPGALFINTAPELEGGLKRFGAPRTRLRLDTDLEIEAALAAHLAASGLPVARAPHPDLTLDHGSQVPLYILSRIIPRLPPVVLANPVGLAPDLALALGRALASFQLPARPRTTGALLASGDLSHRLSPNAPAGFHPEGAAFDRELLAALSAGTGAEMAARWTPERLARAGECGYRSALALSGLAGGPVEIISYEGPFGVGYCHALWRPEEQ